MSPRFTSISILSSLLCAAPLAAQTNATITAPNDAESSEIASISTIKLGTVNASDLSPSNPPPVSILTQVSPPQSAQPAPSPAERAGPPQNIPNLNADFLLLGVGVGVTPDYAGADNFDLLPTPLIIGRYKGFDFATRGPGIAVDLIRDRPFKKVNLILGPLVRFRFDRNNSNQIEDAQVAALDELGIAFEVGASAGFQVNRIFSKFDDITVWVDGGVDVTGTHGGTVISPAATYSTPLSAGIVARLSGGFTYVSDDFVDTYSNIDAANSAASGLAEFQGDGGIRDINTSLLLAIDLDGDVRNGGWGVFGIGSYTRLVSDTARSPIVTETGTPNQFFGAIGIGYSF